MSARHVLKEFRSGKYPFMSTISPKTNTKHKLLIGQILVRAGVLEEHQIPKALQLAQSRSTLIGQAFIAMGYLTADDVDPILQIQQMITDGVVSEDAAVEVLRVVRRDGLPLVHAVAQLDPATQSHHKPRRSDLETSLARMDKDTAPSDTLPILQELADLCMLHRDFDAARQHLDKALYVAEQRHGRQSIRLIPILHEQIDLLMLERNYHDAEQLCWRMIVLSQSSLGTEHIETLKILQRMGRVLDAQGRTSEAESFLINAIRGFEKILGVNTPQVQMALRHFSAFWRRKSVNPGGKGEYKRTGELLAEAQIVTKEEQAEALAKSHQQGIPIGNAFLSSGLISAAVLRAALQSQLLVLDGVIPLAVALQALQVVASRHCPLEHALDEVGFSPDPAALEPLRDLISTMNEVIAAEIDFGIKDSTVAALLAKLGEQQMYSRRFAQSELSYVRSLNILREHPSTKPAEFSAALNRLGNLYYVQKRYAEAQELYWEAFTRLRLAVGDKHPEVAQTLRYLSKVERELGNVEKAEQLWNSAESLDPRRGGAPAPAATAATVPASTVPAPNVPAGSMPAETPDLIKTLTLFESESRSGRINIHNSTGGLVGVLWFKDGVLTAARFRHLEGKFAVIELLMRKDPLTYEISADAEATSDADLPRKSISHWTEQANLRNEALPQLLERCGWPRASWIIDEDREFDAFIDPEIAPIAKEIYALIAARLENTRIMDSINADRYTFLQALRFLIEDNFITRDLEATGSFKRLRDIEEAQKLHTTD